MVEVDWRSEGGFGIEKRSRRRHMWSVPSTTTSPQQQPIIVPTLSSSTSCFLKDGREISVGECALFKLGQDSPPLVGIVRSFTSDKETSLTLGVNWLYRPAGVKLLRGVALEAAPNEVFYTFHRDEIPAASFLHRCKVAFLPKGVELPAGVSSFVCRRVYDITNSCLWWLTDKDYIDVRQEEVDQLLHKTIIEMHASLDQQQGIRSPKPMNGSVATSPQKQSPDSVQNSGSNFSSQMKGKKRDRGYHSSGPIKRERSARGDDGDSGQFRSGSARNFEIAKLTERGLVDSEAVARLVRLMQPEKSHRRIELTERSMLAGIIAATDKHDCLRQFVQLKGIPVLDEWLQEVHKGKFGDCGNHKDSDKAVENFLLVLLGALDKLPVNLNALQMCNIGKSVNHLRSHKNSEIQKRARSLVDTWKKRVEAEMNMNDAKSGSAQMVPWPGRSRDRSRSGNRHSGGSSEAVIRCSATHHSSLKPSSVKHLQVETNSKRGSAHQSNGRSSLSPASTTPSIKDTHSRSTNGGSFEPAHVVIREEKSSSSSPSHTNSQCSSDHVRSMVPVGKEDAQRSTAASKNLKKAAGSGSRDNKSANGSIPGGNNETMPPSRSSSVGRSSLVEKVSQNIIEGSVHEGSNHKLIVKIPNKGRGPAQSVVGASADDNSCRNSEASTPAVSEKHDQSRKHDSHQLSEVDGSSVAMQQRPRDTRRLANIVKPAYSPDRSSTPSDPRISTNILKPVYSADKNEKKSRKIHDSSFSSMNALVESCVKFSEANALMSARDDVGMNLLASVATGEICRSANGSPAASPHRNSTTAKVSGTMDSTTEKELCDADLMNQGGLSIDVAGTDDCNIASCAPKVNDEESANDLVTADGVPPNEEGCLRDNGVLDEQVCTACSTGRNIVHVSMKAPNERDRDVTGEMHSQLTDATQIVGSDVEAEAKVKVAFTNVESEEKSFEDAMCASVVGKDDLKSNVSTGHKSDCSVEQNSTIVPLQSESMSRDTKVTAQHLDAVYSTVKSEDAATVDICDNGGVAVEKTLDQEYGSSQLYEKQEDPGVCSADVTGDNDCKVDKLDEKEVVVQEPVDSGTQVSSSGDILSEELLSSTEEVDVIAVEAERKEDSAIAEVAGAGVIHVGAKLEFDLNEGLNLDDGKYMVAVCLSGGSYAVDGCSANPLEVCVSSAPGCLPAPVTVAATVQGRSFASNVNLSRNKLELGWKGSAATSAFRPAEPKKVVELPPGPIKVLHSDGAAYKQPRPPLDIDLNVADESYCEETNSEYNSVAELRTSTSLRGCGGLDLDLNIADDVPDILEPSASGSQGCDPLIQSVQRLTSSIFLNGEANGKRDFDLNDGPVTNEMPIERTSHSQPTLNSTPLNPALGSRISTSVPGNLFSWYPPGTSYSVSMTPSALHDTQPFPVIAMGGGPHRIMSGPTSSLSFNQDAFRGSSLSSPPAMPFNSAAFQYPVFPFGTGCPLPTSALAGGPSGYVDAATTGRISAFPSQLAGNAMTVPFQYPHAYVVSCPDINNNGAIESNQKCAKQGLDLNSGPGSLDLEGRNEPLPAVSRQISIVGSQSLVEEQPGMYGTGGGALKRKEPEGGWSFDKLGSKESLWR